MHYGFPRVCACLIAGVAMAAPAVADWVPFVVPPVLPTNAPIAWQTAPVGVRSPRVTVDDAHFVLSGDRYRVWGVNMCFGANLPTHADAETTARRMGALGINSVRLHHLDTSPFPAGLLDPADPLRVHPEALDRLDYFVDQLARNGIRVNLNLHVGRRASKPLGIPDPGTDYDKIADLFTPALITAQKDYVRTLLTHTNRYREVTWAADPAVAFVEISNEDSLFMWGAERRLRALPPYYADILRQRYAEWLRRTYGTNESLRAAWSAGAEPLGTNLISTRVSDPGVPPSWMLEVQPPAEAALVAGTTPGSLKVRVRKLDRVDWHIQLKHTPLSVEAGRYYTLAFKARAATNRTISVGVSMDHAPWEGVGLWHWAQLSTNWTSTRVGFAAMTNDTCARLAFVVGGAEGDVEIADVSLRPGGRMGLAPGESMDSASVRLFGECETPARARDRLRFLADTEKAYFDDMRRFIRTDLRCRALVTGTIVFGPVSLYTQSDMDFLDAHAYWQHPRFPGRRWDPADWIVEPQAMVDHPEWATLPTLACGRLYGKPFTVSEYNHAAPNDYQAECVPLIASTAAAQDWDGVWLFAYSHRTAESYREYFDSFFDIDANPAKLGFFPAGTALFREAAMAPLSGGMAFGGTRRAAPLSIASIWQEECDGSVKAAFARSGRDPLTAMQSYRLSLSWRDGLRIKLPTTRSGVTRITWGVDKGKGTYRADSSGGLVWAGWADAAVTSGVRVASPAFAVITVNPLDSRELASSRRLLITACGRCENTGMGFSADRRTVGRNWGRAPVRVETVTGHIPLPPGRWRAWALGADGMKGAEAGVVDAPGGTPELELDGAHRAMWYVAERQ